MEKTVGPGGGGAPGPEDKDELTFLVGNACSRVTNLLISSEVDEARLKVELEFLAEKAARLAALLPGGGGRESGPPG
ncbi:MAG: hypothetical protein Kow00129_04820 [Thermoleophilia bacterium]